MLVFNCLHNLAPTQLSVYHVPAGRADNAGRRHLRSAARGDRAVPATTTLRYGPRSFAVAGSVDRQLGTFFQHWVRSCHLIPSFRGDLKTELFIRAYYQHAHDCF